MRENKEELIKIGQEQIDKAVELFEGKAIDVLDFLTWQFKNDFATDIDNNLNGYKRDFDKLQIEYSKTYMENDRLKAENRQLKSEQNKVAVEKLEEVGEFIEDELNSFSWDGDRSRYYTLISVKNLIKELKGESDD